MTTTTNLIDQMQTQVQTWHTAKDDRAVFLECYMMMTRNMLATVKEGGFQDGPWVTTLTHEFAAYYFDALKHYENEASPPVWTFAFDVAETRKAHVLQNLLLGVNAHICYDLIFALVDCVEHEWDDLCEEEREARRSDFYHVNEVIGATLDAVQDEVVEENNRIMQFVDDVFGRLDELMIHSLICRWRDQVWQQSMAYLEASPEERTQLRHTYTQQAEQRARAIQGQRGLLGIVDIF